MPTQAIAARAARRRARCALARLARADLDNDSFRYEAAAILRQAVGFDWWCWPLADPGARLPTRYAGVDAPTDQDQRRFCRLVLETWDGGQHCGRGGSQPPAVTALSAATGGDLSRDLFWREILGPAGAGDVLDVMLATDGVCWGQLHLGRDSPGRWFGEDEAGFVGEVAPLIAVRLRDGLRAPCAHDGPDPEPGTIIVDRDLSLVAATDSAWRWIDRLGLQRPSDAEPLPGFIYAAAAPWLEVGPSLAAALRAAVRSDCFCPTSCSVPPYRPITSKRSSPIRRPQPPGVSPPAARRAMTDQASRIPRAPASTSDD
jgi:hypothetical protein